MKQETSTKQETRACTVTVLDYFGEVIAEVRIKAGSFDEAYNKVYSKYHGQNVMGYVFD